MQNVQLSNEFFATFSSLAVDFRSSGHKSVVARQIPQTAGAMSLFFPAFSLTFTTYKMF
jgi:hypothetical protein